MRAPELEPPTRFHPRMAFRLGVVMVVAGSLLAGRFFDFGIAVATPIAVAVLGVGLMVFAARALAMRHAIDVEVADAIDRRQELSSEITRLAAKGGKVTRFLEAAGFAQPVVRRWITAQFGSNRPVTPITPLAPTASAGSGSPTGFPAPAAPRAAQPSAFARSGPPTFGDSLLSLDPRAKIAAGALLLLVAIATFRPIRGAVVVGYFNLGLIALGFCALLLGISEQRRKRAMEREIALALERRSELEHALAELDANGGNIARFLQQEGFRDYGVRRWIATEFVEAPPTD